MINKHGRRAYGPYDQIWGGGYAEKRERKGLYVIDLFKKPPYVVKIKAIPYPVVYDIPQFQNLIEV